MDSNLGWADHSGHQRSPSRYATFELLTFPSLRLVAKVPFGVRADPVPRIFWGSATHAAHTRTRTHARSVGLLYPGVVAVLNPIPEWIVIFSATMVAAALTNIKSAIRKVAKRITKGKVIKMAMKLTAALWWASACVVGMISTSPAESG